MGERKRGWRDTGDVNFYVDKVVIAFFLLPTIPLGQALSGTGRLPSSSEMTGFVVVSVILWAIALYVGRRAGGPRYLAETVAFSLFLCPLIPWIAALFGDPEPEGAGGGRLILVTPALWAAAAAVAWVARVGPFAPSGDDVPPRPT